MAPDTAFADHALDLLTQVGPPFDTDARLRRMFGGHGIFCDGVMFALISDDVLFLKIDAETKTAFMDAGSQPFTYAKANRNVELTYWTVPDEASEDVDELLVNVEVRLSRLVQRGQHSYSRVGLFETTEMNFPFYRIPA